VYVNVLGVLVSAVFLFGVCFQTMNLAISRCDFSPLTCTQCFVPPSADLQAWNRTKHVEDCSLTKTILKRLDSANRESFVTVRLSLNFIIGCWGSALDREDRVS
jgi:hypothetical protein